MFKETGMIISVGIVSGLEIYSPIEINTQEIDLEEEKEYLEIEDKCYEEGYVTSTLFSYIRNLEKRLEEFSSDFKEYLQS